MQMMLRKGLGEDPETQHLWENADPASPDLDLSRLENLEPCIAAVNKLPGLRCFAMAV